MIRPAVESDIDQLCGIIERFIEELTWDLTYDPRITQETFLNLIANRNIILVSEEEDVLTGFIAGYVYRDFFCESCGYIKTFYVDKALRGTGTSRELIKAFDDEAFQRGATIIFAATHAGVGLLAEKLFINLFNRLGYSVAGRSVSKEIR